MKTAVRSLRESVFRTGLQIMDVPGLETAKTNEPICQSPRVFPMRASLNGKHINMWMLYRHSQSSEDTFHPLLITVFLFYKAVTTCC